MSHEGIRIERQDPARGAETPKLTGDAIRPAKVKVDKSGGTGVVIEWKDGHKSSWNFAWLRAACPCATCHEERGKSGRQPGVPKPKAQTLLMMYEAPARPVEVTPVGKYALKFKWSDGHEAGIYSWEYLRRVCRCDECVAGRGIA